MKVVPSSVTKQVFRASLKLKKVSPNLLFAGGVAGVVVSTVMACKATLKLADDLPVMRDNLDVIRETIKEPEDQRKAIAQAYGVHAGHVVKLYAPAVIVGGVAITALTGSHVVLTRRNASLTAAYAAVAKAYEDYRMRVREELGADSELALYRASREIPAENGKDMVVSVDPNGRSPYARFFDECSTEWQKNAEMNRLFVQTQQTWANEKLRAKGHLFLNEVYDMLGLERSKAGAVVGWVINKNGDNYVDFGLFEASSAPFINGYERSVLLDFNVDGVIYDMI